jgi:hypothetical protein
MTLRGRLLLSLKLFPFKTAELAKRGGESRPTGGGSSPLDWSAAAAAAAPLLSPRIPVPVRVQCGPGHSA